MKRGRGRPCKLTPERQARICQAIAAGNYYEAAAAYGGVHYAIFRMWMVRGEKEKSGKFHDFCEAVHKAEADAEVSLVGQWKAKVPEDWRAARDFLARRFPKRWGPKEEHDIKGGVTLGVVEEIVHASGKHTTNGHTNGAAQPGAGRLPQ